MTPPFNYNCFVCVMYYYLCSKKHLYVKFRKFLLSIDTDSELFFQAQTKMSVEDGAFTSKGIDDMVNMDNM